MIQLFEINGAKLSGLGCAVLQYNSTAAQSLFGLVSKPIMFDASSSLLLLYKLLLAMVEMLLSILLTMVDIDVIMSVESRRSDTVTSTGYQDKTQDGEFGCMHFKSAKLCS